MDQVNSSIDIIDLHDSLYNPDKYLICYTTTNIKNDYLVDTYEKSTSYVNSKLAFYYEKFTRKPTLLQKFKINLLDKKCLNEQMVKKIKFEKNSDNMGFVNRFLKQRFPEKKYLTIVNGSPNFYALNNHKKTKKSSKNISFNTCPKKKFKKTKNKQKQIRNNKKSLIANKKPYTFAKTMWQFWWPYDSYEEAKENNFENLIFNKYKISNFKKFIKRKKNNLRITKLLNLIGKMCTYSAYTKAGVEHNLELCNLHYIRKFKIKLNKKKNIHEQKDSDFFGLFNDPVYYESNIKLESLTEMEKVRFLREKDENQTKKKKVKR